MITNIEEEAKTATTKLVYYQQFKGWKKNIWKLKLNQIFKNLRTKTKQI